MSDCAHNQFKTVGRVARLTDGDGGPVTGYAVDFTVTCVECGTPFCFIGMDAGSSPRKPMVSVDATEVRMPIAPQGTTPSALDVIGAGLARGDGTLQ